MYDLILNWFYPEIQNRKYPVEISCTTCTTCTVCVSHHSTLCVSLRHNKHDELKKDKERDVPGLPTWWRICFLAEQWAPRTVSGRRQTSGALQLVHNGPFVNNYWKRRGNGTDGRERRKRDRYGNEKRRDEGEGKERINEWSTRWEEEGRHRKDMSNC